MSPENCTHLFISYAFEDAAFAKWLARKLAAVGYLVWFDQLKMLGGEPWPTEIDAAIKQRTLRMLAILSKASRDKPNPSKERALGFRLSKERGIKDFVIPLKLDDVDLDWLTSDISYIPFMNGWAGVLRQLIEKLDNLNAPRDHSRGPELAIATFPDGRELVSDTSEELIANAIRVEGVPAALQAYRWRTAPSPGERERIEQAWSFYELGDELLAFGAPPRQVAVHVHNKKHQYSWADCERIGGANPRDVAATIVVTTIKRRLLAQGFLAHPKQRQVVYLSENAGTNNRLTFEGRTKRKTWIKIRGKVTFFRIGRPKELVHHQFALRLRLARGLDKSLWLQIQPTLFLFDAAGEPIVDDRVGPRRRQLTRAWWNDKWVNRLLAVESLLQAQPHTDDDPIHLTGGFLRVVANRSLDEAHFDAPDETAEDDLEEVPIELEDDEETDESAERAAPGTGDA